MNDKNSDALSTTASVGTPAPYSKILLYLLCGLIALQFIGTLLDTKLYFDLVRTGTVPAIASVFGVAGNVSLYLAAIRVLLNPRRGRIFFLIAAIGLALSALFLGWRWGLIAIFGIILGACGYWLTRKNRWND